MICVNVDRGMSVEELSKYVRDLFKFIPTQKLTLKWVDEEGGSQGEVFRSNSSVQNGTCMSCLPNVKAKNYLKYWFYSY